jgi:hypothetical protein
MSSVITFSHTQATTASPEKVWAHWTDVKSWPKEDANLEWSRLEGAFGVGGKIVMKPKQGPKSVVKITESTPNRSFTAEGSIPLGKLRFRQK